MSYQLIQRRLPVFAFHWSRIHTSTKAVAQKIPEARFISPYHDHVRLFSTSPLTPTNHEELLKHLHHHHHHHSIIRRRTRSNQRPFSTFGNRPPIVTFDKNNPKDPNEFFIQENDDIRHILHETNLGCMTSKQIAHAKSLIHDLSNLRTFQGAHLAEEILERLYAEGVDGGNRQVQQQLEPKLYNIIIDAYGKSGQGSGVDKAEALMERMKERSRVSIDLGNNEKDVFMTGPDLFSYNSLLNAWSLSKREDAVTKVEKIVEFLESSSNSSRSSSSSSSSSSNDVVKPNSVTYNIMMNTYANQVGEYGYAQKAEDILLHMTSLQKDGNEAIHPDTTSFNIVLKAWKNSGGGVESAKRAEEILRLMVKLYVDGHHDLKPDHVSFRTVIHAYMKHGEDGKLSNEIVDRIQGIGELVLDDGIDYFSDNPDIVSNVISEVLMCLAKSGAVDVGKRAKNLFDKLNQARDTNEHVHVGKEEETYVNTIIALLSDPKTANLGHDMMQNMLEGNSSILPRTQDLNRILHLYCQNQNVAAAQDLYLTMLRLAKTQGFETMPDIATYNMMANLCFQSNDDSSFPLALMVLDQMEEDYKTGLLSNLSDFVYKIVIHKLTKSKLPTSQGANAYDVLMRMINSYDNGGLEREPETVLFNMVLSSIMNQSMENKAEKALEVLQLMRERAKSGKSQTYPDTRTYSHILGILRKDKKVRYSRKIFDVIQMMEDEENERHVLLFDNIVFETALRGLSDDQDSDGALADEVLKKMFVLHRNGHKLVTPNSKCVDLAIKAQLSGDSSTAHCKIIFDAHRYLMSIVSMYEKGESKVLPTRVGFNTVLARWEKTRHLKSVVKAEEIYTAMNRLSMNGAVDVSPNSFTNNAMMRVFARDRKIKSTFKALNFFKSIRDEQLDALTYICILRILAGSRINNKVEIASDILLDMERRKLTDVASYNAVLSACTTSDTTNKQRLLDFAVETYRRLIEFTNPDELSFVLIIRAWKKLSNDNSEIERNLSLLYKDACDRGMQGTRLKDELKENEYIWDKNYA